MNLKHNKRVLAITIAAAVSMTVMNSASASLSKPRHRSKTSGKNQPTTSMSRDELNKIVESDVAHQADEEKFLGIGPCTFGCSSTTTTIHTHAPTDLTNVYNLIGHNSALVARNLHFITLHTAQIGALTTDFGSLQGQVTTNLNDITQNTSDITQNTSDIAQNTNDITQNTSNIAQNTSDITQNTNDITQNTNNIAQNASDINKLDTTTQNLSAAVNVNTQNINILGNSVNKIIDNVNYLNQLTQKQGNEIQANTTKINYVQGVAQNNALNIVKNANAIAFNALNSAVLAHSIKQNADRLLKNLGIIAEVNNEVEMTGEMSQTDFTRLRQAVLENSDALGERSEAFTQGLVMPNMNEAGLTKANVNIKTLIRRATSSAEFALGHQHHALNGLLTVLALTNAIHNAFVAHVALWQSKNPPSELLKGLDGLMKNESDALQKLQNDPAIKKALMPASSTNNLLDVPDIQSSMLAPSTIRGKY